MHRIDSGPGTTCIPDGPECVRRLVAFEWMGRVIERLPHAGLHPLSMPGARDRRRGPSSRED